MRYFDEYGIPFGKHKLANITEDIQINNAVEALRRNLVFRIGNEVLHYTIKAKSNNKFELIVKPDKSYLAESASL